MQSLKLNKTHPLSIILPVYNAEKYIARALKSCINQSFRDLEIIIVDDCGSDCSIEIAYAFAKADDRIKIIHNPKNLKLLQTRLEGVKVATSDYIMFLDSDDYLDPFICEKIAQTLEKTNNLDILCFGMLMENKHQFSKINYGIKGDCILSRDAYCELVLQRGHCYWNLCGKVFKREIYLKALENLNHLSLNMAEDVLAYFLILFHTSSLFFLDQEGYFYCDNAESLTRNPNIENKIENLIEEEAVIQYILQTLPTISNQAFFRLAKVMLRNLKFYHQRNKNALPYLKHKTLGSKILMKWKNLLTSLEYKIRKNIKSINE